MTGRPLRPAWASAAGRSCAGSAATGHRMGPVSSRRRAASAAASARTSPWADSTVRNPTARAEAAVASPTAKARIWRSPLSAANAATALALVNATALTSVRSMTASLTARTSSSGATRALKPSARTRSAVASAAGWVRVIQTSAPGRSGAGPPPAAGSASSELERVAGLGADRFPEPDPERAGGDLGIGAPKLDLALATEAPRAVRRQGLDDQRQAGAIKAGVGADGGLARSLQRRQRTALRRHPHRGDRIAQRDGPGRVPIGLASLDGQRALTRRGRTVDRIDDRGDAPVEPEPLQSRQRQNDGVGLATVELGQARVDVATQVDQLQVRPLMQRLGLA